MAQCNDMQPHVERRWGAAKAAALEAVRSCRDAAATQEHALGVALSGAEPGAPPGAPHPPLALPSLAASLLRHRPAPCPRLDSCPRPRRAHSPLTANRRPPTAAARRRRRRVRAPRGAVARGAAQAPTARELRFISRVRPSRPRPPCSGVAARDCTLAHDICPPTLRCRSPVLYWPGREWRRGLCHRPNARPHADLSHFPATPQAASTGRRRRGALPAGLPEPGRRASCGGRACL